jgi:hypothetical protein
MAMPTSTAANAKSVTLISQGDAFVVLTNIEMFREGFGDPLMYTNMIAGFCIPKRLCGESVSGQHPSIFRPMFESRRTRGAVRFLFWWLFLHRRLRPRQRGSTTPKGFERLCTHWLIISVGRYPFLSG